jgi:hypothetical protein
MLELGSPTLVGWLTLRESAPAVEHRDADLPATPVGWQVIGDHTASLNKRPSTSPVPAINLD